MNNISSILSAGATNKKDFRPRPEGIEMVGILFADEGTNNNCL